MIMYFQKTESLLLLNGIFVLINLCIFTSVKSPPKPLERNSYVKQANFQDLDDHLLIYGKEQDDNIEITFEDRPKKADPYYLVPDIERTTLVNCRALLAGSKSEIEKAEKVMNEQPKVPILEEVFLEWTKDCKKYKFKRGYVKVPLSQEEADFPLAFSIAMYKDIEQVERLLRSIYQPQNLYCIHIDIKSSLLLHRTMHRLANCFHNVFIASHLDKIKWGDVSVLLPDLNCMRDLVKSHSKKWKYYINLTGQEMPLRSNYELVKIAKIFNGSNDIAGSISSMDMERVQFKWGHRWSKTYQQTILYNSYEPKSPAPYNITFYKGEIHGLFSEKMVHFIVKDEVAQQYLDWCWDTGHASEHYYNVLNYNKHLHVPGGYTGHLKVAENYATEPIIRVKNWNGLYNDRPCQGKIVRGICVYGVGDIMWLYKRPELFANKFHLDFHYLAYDCMEELHRNQTKKKTRVKFDKNKYINLPTVRYSRKDGLFEHTDI